MNKYKKLLWILNKDFFLKSSKNIVCFFEIPKPAFARKQIERLATNAGDAEYS